MTRCPLWCTLDGLAKSPEKKGSIASSDFRTHRCGCGVIQVQTLHRGSLLRGVVRACPQKSHSMTGDPSLFADWQGTDGDFAADILPAGAPLAARMRPRSLDEFVGQEHLVGKGSALRAAIERHAPSLHHLVGAARERQDDARAIDRSGDILAHRSALRSCSAGVADLRRAIAEAKRAASSGKRTILFIDEIHRFNRAQQDAVLPNVERGDITLIGATTENPSFEVNKALLSRSRVFVLNQLSDEALGSIIERARSDATVGSRRAASTFGDGARETKLIALAGGDARSALNALELAVEIAAARDGSTHDRSSRRGRGDAAARSSLRSGR